MKRIMDSDSREVARERIREGFRAKGLSEEKIRTIEMLMTQWANRPNAIQEAMSGYAGRVIE